MGGFTKTGVAACDQACILAEGIRQAAVAGVTIKAAGQVVANNAEIAFCRAFIASLQSKQQLAGYESLHQSVESACNRRGLNVDRYFPRTCSATAPASRTPLRRQRSGSRS